MSTTTPINDPGLKNRQRETLQLIKQAYAAKQLTFKNIRRYQGKMAPVGTRWIEIYWNDGKKDIYDGALSLDKEVETKLKPTGNLDQFLMAQLAIQMAKVEPSFNN